MMKKLLLIAVLTHLMVLPAYPAMAAPSEKVTICHAAGQEGTTHYITLTIGYNAVYGPAGHFFENGTPRAGHEQDYLGPCVDESPEPTPTEDPSPTPTDDPSPTPTEEPTPEPTDEPTDGPPVVQDPPDRGKPDLPEGGEPSKKQLRGELAQTGFATDVLIFLVAFFGLMGAISLAGNWWLGRKAR